MDKLKECALQFQKLFETDYVITAVKKEKVLKVSIFFSDEQFHHLIGLNKLKDIDTLRGNRIQIFSNILKVLLLMRTSKTAISLTVLMNA